MPWLFVAAVGNTCSHLPIFGVGLAQWNDSSLEKTLSRRVACSDWKQRSSWSIVLSAIMVLLSWEYLQTHGRHWSWPPLYPRQQWPIYELYHYLELYRPLHNCAHPMWLVFSWVRPHKLPLVEFWCERPTDCKIAHTIFKVINYFVFVSTSCSGNLKEERIV